MGVSFPADNGLCLNLPCFPGAHVPLSQPHAGTQDPGLSYLGTFYSSRPTCAAQLSPRVGRGLLGRGDGSGRPGSRRQCLTLNRPPSTPGSPRRLSGLGNRSLDFSWKCFEPPHFERGVRAPACPCRPRDGGRVARSQAPRSGQHGCDALLLLFQEHPPLPFLSAGFPNILCREGGKIYSGNYFLTVW